MRFTRSVDGAAIAYEVVGDGAWLVCPMLHAPWGTRDLVPELEEHRRLLMVDCRGFGKSERVAPENYHLDLFVADVFAAANDAGADEFSIFGYATAGFLATVVAARSDRVQRLVVGGYSLLDMPHERMPHGKSNTVSKLLRALGLVRPTDTGYFWDETPIHRPAVASLGQASAQWNASEDLSRVVRPAVLFYGSKDRTWQIARRIEGTRGELEALGFTVVKVAGVDHNGLAIDARTLACLIGDFL